MSEKNKLQSELGDGAEQSKEMSLLDVIKIMETSGDVIDHKIYNHDYKMASHFPTPDIEEAKGPYFEEEDYYRFFSGEDDVSLEDQVSEDSIPKINSNSNRFYKIKKIFGAIKWIL